MSHRRHRRAPFRVFRDSSVASVIRTNKGRETQKMTLQAFEKALQLTESLENAALLRRVEALELALCPSRQTNLPQLLLLRVSAQLPQRDVLAARDLSAGFVPRLLPVGMAGQHKVFPRLSVHRQQNADGLAVAGKQQCLFAPLHILQEGRSLLTELTDADNAHRDHCRDSTPWTGILQGGEPIEEVRSTARRGVNRRRRIEYMGQDLSRKQRSGLHKKVLQSPTERPDAPALIMQMVWEMREPVPSIVHPMVRQRISPQQNAAALRYKHIAVQRNNQLMLAHLVFFPNLQAMARGNGNMRLQGPRTGQGLWLLRPKAALAARGSSCDSRWPRPENQDGLQQASPRSACRRPPSACCTASHRDGAARSSGPRLGRRSPGQRARAGGTGVWRVSWVSYLNYSAQIREGQGGESRRSP